MSAPRRFQKIVGRHYVASEKTVEHWCDELVAKLGGTVVRFSQSRATRQTEGIPDRLYRVKDFSLWFEVKAEGGKLTRAQWEFLRAELACHHLAACGGVEELQAVLAIRTGRAGGDAYLDALDKCHQIVQSWETRGFRGEKKSPSARITK